LLLAACFGGGPEVSASGKGLPLTTVEFPAGSAAGSAHTAELTVDNPGPGDIPALAVTFGRVGAPAAEGLPNPLVDRGRSAETGSIVEVRPRPSASIPNVIYRFGPLPEGESVTIEFVVKVPEAPGVAASSVIVYDAAEPDRASGVRLETLVER
jgi:hypothetical protein